MTVSKIENGLERGFVKHRLNCLLITDPLTLFFSNVFTLRGLTVMVPYFFLYKVIFIWQCVDWSGLSLGDYKYPAWAEAAGWGLCLASVLCVPGYAMYRLFCGDKSRPVSEVTVQAYLVVILTRFRKLNHL